MKNNLSTKKNAFKQEYLLDKKKELVFELMNRQKYLFQQKVILPMEKEITKIDLEIKMYQSLQDYGWIYVSAWSRDCDMCESTRVYKFQSIKAYYKAERRFYEGLEGTGCFSLCSKSQYDDEMREPTRTRDRIMEAYENGNGWSIYV